MPPNIKKIIELAEQADLIKKKKGSARLEAKHRRDADLFEWEEAKTKQYRELLDAKADTRELPDFDNFVDNEQVGLEVAKSDFSLAAKRAYMEDGTAESGVTRGITGFMRVDELLALTGKRGSGDVGVKGHPAYSKLAKEQASTGFQEPIRIFGRYEGGVFVSDRFDNAYTAQLLADQGKTGVKIPVIFHVGTEPKYLIENGQLALPKFYTDGVPEFIRSRDGTYTKFPRTSRMSLNQSEEVRLAALTDVNHPSHATMQPASDAEAFAWVQGALDPEQAHIASARLRKVKADRVHSGQSIREHWANTTHEVDAGAVGLARERAQYFIDADYRILAMVSKREAKHIEEFLEGSPYVREDGTPVLLYRTEMQVRPDELIMPDGRRGFRNYLADVAIEIGAHFGTVGQANTFLWNFTARNKNNWKIIDKDIASIVKSTGLPDKQIRSIAEEIANKSIIAYADDTPILLRDTQLFDYDKFLGMFTQAIKKAGGDVTETEKLGLLADGLDSILKPKRYAGVFRGKRPLVVMDDGSFSNSSVASQMLDMPEFERYADELYDLAIEKGGVEEANKIATARIREIVENEGFDHIAYYNLVEDVDSLPAPSIINWNPDLYEVLDIHTPEKLAKNQFLQVMIGAALGGMAGLSSLEPEKDKL